MLTIFDKAILSLGTTRVMSNVARRVGSSQQGNARRAPVGFNLQYPILPPISLICDPSNKPPPSSLQFASVNHAFMWFPSSVAKSHLLIFLQLEN